VAGSGSPRWAGGMAGAAGSGASPQARTGTGSVDPGLPRTAHGAEAYGFRGEVWTWARVAQVIEEEFGVCYHRSQVSRLLKELGWTPQMPIARAIQRDEPEIERWRAEVGPQRRTRARRERRGLVFVDESGFYLLPGWVQTHAPKGHTPVLREWQTRDHLSVTGGVTPTGRIDVLVRQESLNGWHAVEFLKHLIRYVGPRLLVIGEGSPIHRRVAVEEFLEDADGRGVQVEVCPPYAQTSTRSRQLGSTSSMSSCAI
jgi:hypothetical protein